MTLKKYLSFGRIDSSYGSSGSFGKLDEGRQKRIAQSSTTELRGALPILREYFSEHRKTREEYERTFKKKKEKK